MLKAYFVQIGGNYKGQVVFGIYVDAISKEEALAKAFDYFSKGVPTEEFLYEFKYSRNTVIDLTEF